MVAKKPANHPATTRASILFCGALLMLAFILVTAGCGDSSSSSDNTKSSLPGGGVSRPSAGTVEVIDGLGDTSAPDGTAAPAPREADINRVQISKEGDNLKMAMEVSGPVPETKPFSVGAAEWGFLLDTDGDGEADWGVFADFPPNQEAWTWGLYNVKTKQRVTEAQSQVAFEHAGSTLVLTVPATAIGSPQSFKWRAYTDDAARPTPAAPTDMKQAGDKVPSDGWLDYP
jgi:hypothetical protein